MHKMKVIILYERPKNNLYVTQLPNNIVHWSPKRLKLIKTYDKIKKTKQAGAELCQAQLRFEV